MSGGVNLPRFSITVPQRASVSVAAQGRPVVASVTVRGQQGAQGAQGVQGPSGITTGFGQITYTDRTIGPEDSFAPGVRQRLMFNPDALQTTDYLNPPFKGFAFFVNNTLRARATGDLYFLAINLLVTAQQAGGQIRVDVDAGSVLGPIQSNTASLLEGAGVQERVTLLFEVQVLTNFLANGAQFYLTATRPVTVVSETLLVDPRSIQP